MRSIKSLLVLCLAILVVGCAGSYRPNMSEEQYQASATAAAILVRCVETNQLDVNTVASAKIAYNNLINQFEFDSARLQQIARSKSVNPSANECRNITIQLAEWQQRQTMANQPPPAAPQPSFSQPARTICNNIAGQILCSTY